MARPGTGVTVRGRADSGGMGSSPTETQVDDVDRLRGQMDTLLAPPPGGLSRLTAPYYIAHRCGKLLHVENTFEAAVAIVAQGAKCIEFDVTTLADGALGVYHDPTVDASTNGVGAVNGFTAAGFKALTLDDEPPKIGGVYATATLHPPLGGEIIREFGNWVHMNIEAKVAGSGARLVALLQRYQVHPDACTVASFIGAELSAAKAAGYITMRLGDSEAIIDAAAAAGHPWIGVPDASANALTPYALAKGMRVAVYTINHRWRRDELLALGVEAFFTDDPIYLEGTNLPTRTTDPYDAGSRYPGHWTSSVSAPGDFPGDGSYRFGSSAANTLRSVRAGWVALNAGDQDWAMAWHTVFDSAFSATRWAGLFLANHDRPFLDAAGAVGVDGYLAMMRKNGTIALFRYAAGGNLSLIDFAGAATAIPDAGPADWLLTVTSAGLTLARTDIPYNVTIADAAVAKGGYVHLVTSGLVARFSDMVLTP